MLGTPTALPDCRPLLADPDDLTLVFQPVVDLAAATVAGYQALARFPGTSGSDVWFAAAAAAGVDAELEALAIHKALAVVPELPAGTFLSIDVSARLLGHPAVQAALATGPDLRRVVVALTGHTSVHDLRNPDLRNPDLRRPDLRRPDLRALQRRAQDLRARGALVALDAAGSGGSGLERLAILRPQVLVLDRGLVGDADTDPVRRALAEMVRELAGRTDAWLLAEGLETTAELAAVMRLGVPLGRGWVLGRPSPGFAPLPPRVVDLVAGQAARVRRTASVAGLLHPIRQCEDGDVLVGPPPAVLVGPLGEPLALLLQDARTGETYRAPVSLCVHPSSDVEVALRRALTRPPAQRFDPLVCTDATGAVVGLLRIEDLARARR